MTGASTHLLQHVLAALVATGQEGVGLRIEQGESELSLHISEERIAVLVSSLVLVHLPEEGSGVAVVAERRAGFGEVLLL
eukprot:1187958-Prorocentrum_minimum.AAC.2